MASISVPDRVPSPAEDAEDIRKAVQGFWKGKALIEILGHRTAAQRAGIAVAYEDLYDERLVHRLNKELFGHFRDAMMMWTMDPAARDAKLAYETLGRNNWQLTLVLVEIACASLPGHLVAVKRCYRSTYASSLQRDVASCSCYEGPIKEFLVRLVSLDRPAGEHVDDVQARADAAVLHSAVVVQKQPLHEDVIRIVSSRSKPQLKATFEHYKQQQGKALDEVLRGNRHDQLSASLKTVVWCLTFPEKHFAEVIRASISRGRCDDEALTRAIFSRAEIDMKKVKKEYKARYRTTVTNAIVRNTSGYYKDILLTLVGPG